MTEEMRRAIFDYVGAQVDLRAANRALFLANQARENAQLSVQAAWRQVKSLNPLQGVYTLIELDTAIVVDDSDYPELQELR